MPLDTCPHSEPLCETEEKCADRERFRRNCESIQFTSMSPRAEAVRQRDKDFAKDADAYRRLRKEGVQPRGVDKSSMLEKAADHKVEVELGRSITSQEVKLYNRNLVPIK